MKVNMQLGDTQLIYKKALKKNILRNQLAYILATAYWETGRTMKPVKEAYWLSENWRKKNLRYYPWYGRGYVQLTWETNYKKVSQKYNIPWSKAPDFALDPEIAADILIDGSMEGWFTGKKISDYITLSKSDFISARRVINGTDKAKEIADIAKAYDAELKTIGYGETSLNNTQTEDRYTHPEEVNPKPKWYELLIDFIVEIIANRRH